MWWRRNSKRKNKNAFSSYTIIHIGQTICCFTLIHMCFFHCINYTYIRHIFTFFGSVHVVPIFLSSESFPSLVIDWKRFRVSLLTVLQALDSFQPNFHRTMLAIRLLRRTTKDLPNIPKLNNLIKRTKKSRTLICAPNSYFFSIQFHIFLCWILIFL